MFPVVFVLLFFLPYIAGSRLRFDLLLCYVAAFYLLFSPDLIIKEAIKPLHGLLSLSIISVFFSASCLILPEIDLFAKINILTNYNFMFLSLCVFIVFYHRLIRSGERILTVLLLVSLPINAVAIGQWIDPVSGFNKTMYGLYGGLAPEEATQAGFDNFAEFLAVSAHRYPSIFNGMHVLALFNLIIISIGINFLISQGLSSHQRRILSVTAVSMAFVGGAVSFSKTFLFGFMLLLAFQMILSGRIKIFIRFVAISALVLTAFALFIFYAGLDERLMEYINADALATRYGEGAYLANELAAIDTDFVFFIFGAGSTLSNYKLADSLYISVIVVGGVFYLIVYMLPYILLIRMNYAEHRRGNTWARSFAATHLTFLIIGVGIPVYQVGRIAALLIIINLCILTGRPRMHDVNIRGIGVAG